MPGVTDRIPTPAPSKPETNAFANLVSLPKVQMKKPEAKKKDKEEVEFGIELDVYSAIKALEDVLKSYKEQNKAICDDQMEEHFTQFSFDFKKKPVSFAAVSNSATATCIPGKRSTSSHLTPEQVELLEQHNIPIDTKELVPAIPELIAFNPSIPLDKKLAQKISDALASIPELRGQQVLVKQDAQEAQAVKVVSEHAADFIAANIKDKTLMQKLLGIVTTKSLKAKLTNPTLDNVFSILKKANIKLG